MKTSTETSTKITKNSTQKFCKKLFIEGNFKENFQKIQNQNKVPNFFQKWGLLPAARKISNGPI